MYYIWCDDDGIIGSSKVLIMVSNNLTTNHPSWLFFPSLPHWQARANTLHLNSYLFVFVCVCMFYLYLCFYFDLYLAENCRELAKSPKVAGQGFPLTEPCDQLVFMATSPLLGGGRSFLWARICISEISSSVLWTKLRKQITVGKQIVNLYIHWTLLVCYVFLQSKKKIWFAMFSFVGHWATQVKKTDDHTSSPNLTACRQVSVSKSNPFSIFRPNVGKIILQNLLRVAQPI